MAMVTAAVELVSGMPDAFTTSTVIGPPPAAEVITAPVAVLLGSPLNFRKHDPVPVTVPERFPVLAGSSWKSLPIPLKSFDCLASTPHW
jgi:hypothetical protein